MGGHMKHQSVPLEEAKAIEVEVEKMFEEAHKKYGERILLWAAIAYTQHYANGMTLSKAHDLKRKAGLSV